MNLKTNWRTPRWSTAVGVTENKTAGRADLLSSMKLYYALANDVALDSSGESNDGEIIGAGFVDGMFGSALYFNGDSDCVEVEDSDSLNPTDKTIMRFG